MSKKLIDNLLVWTIYIVLFAISLQSVWIVWAPYVHGALWQYGVIRWYVTEMLVWSVVLLALLWMWQRIRTHSQQPFAWTQERLAVMSVAGVLVYAYVSALWAPNAALALQHARWLFAAFLLGMALLIAPIDWRRAAHAFVAGAVLQSLIALWQFFTQVVSPSTWLGVAEQLAATPGVSVVASASVGRWLRAYGTLPHPNILGGFLLITLSVTLLLARHAHTQRERVYLLVVTILQTAALGVSFSRSAWVGWVILMGVLLCMYRRPLRKYIYGFVFASVFTALAFAILYAPLLETRLFGASTTELQSVTQRVAYTSEAGALLQEAPWFGVAVGNYTAAVHMRAPQAPGWALQPVHIVPFVVLVEFGVVGVIFILIALWHWWRFVPLRGRRMVYVLGVPLLPLFLFDHYVYTQWVGLLMFCAYTALLYRYVLVEKEGGTLDRTRE